MTMIRAPVLGLFNRVLIVWSHHSSVADRTASLSRSVTLCGSSTTTRSAAADPQQFPDLSGCTDVNYKLYLTYAAYSTTGAQFVTPGGYRCRISYIFKASASLMQCWGSLPDTANNLVGLSYPGGPDKGGQP